MEKLKLKKEVVRIVGRNTALSFKFASDGILFFSSVIPKDTHGAEECIFDIEVHFGPLEEFYDFMTLAELLYRRRLFRVTMRALIGDPEIIFFKSHNEN